MGLARTPARDLDKFVQEDLLPHRDFLDQLSQAVNTICKVLREKCFQNSASKVRVTKVLKGGSYGRGTVLRGGSDADLVVFLSCFKTFADQGAWQPESFTEIRAQLEACWQNPPQSLNLQFPTQEDARALRFRLVSETLHNWMDVSLRPAFDALGQLRSDSKPSPQIYADLISCGSPAGTYTACFTDLRRHFVNTRPCKLKNLILLVKHWYLLVTEAHQKKLQSTKASLPPVYALELLTIYAWEKGCGKAKFNIAEGFRTVLGLIQKYQELCIYWEVNYSFEDEAVGAFLRNQLKKPRPVILDPADPTWDVGHRDGQNWDLLAQEAKSCLSYPCFVQGDGSPVQPWCALGLLAPRTESKVGDHMEKENGVPKSNGSCANTIPKSPRSSNGETSKQKPGPGRTIKSADPNRTDIDLYHIPAKDLDKFIQDVLQPDAGFQEQMGKVTDMIFKCLREKCFRASSPTIRVLRASKGGSYGRGTVLRGGSDADLVVFLSCFKAFADQGAWQPESFTEIRAQLEACWQNPPQSLSLQFSAQEDARALRFRLVSATLHNWMDVSLRPAFDALGPLNPGSKPRPQVYVDLISNGSAAGTYSECFTELQRDFVNNRPSKLKNLILLVKHWYQQVTSQDKVGQDDECLPPVYALELLTIYAWERAGKKNKFHMAEGFLTVLGLIRDYQQLCIYWTINYDFEDKTIRKCLQKQLQKPRPLILDPADPTWNVGQGNWERLAREAETCGHPPCFVNGDGSPVQPWDVMPALLQQTPSWQLDSFISKFLQPNREFLDQVSRAVDIICSFLKENCFRNSSTKVLKIVKGGSSAKGTALRGRSDADLIVFLSCFCGFSDQGTNRAEIITEIRTQLEACRQEKQFDVKFEISKWENPRVLSFTLTSRTLDHSIDFDVLPAFNALGQLSSGTKPKPQVYIDLIDSYNNGGEFSSCFTELQRDFVISRPTKLKSLIRLVKHWYKQCVRVPKGRGALPPQYALELLTIYAWEQGNGTTQFNMAEGFRTVLELVQNYKNLCIHWTINYDHENEIIKNFLIQQLRKPRPIILDPADPTGNLGHGTRWDLLAKEAANYANSVCCANTSGDFVQPWALKVPGLAAVIHLEDAKKQHDRYKSRSGRRSVCWFTNLYLEPAENLDQFIQNNLQPPKKELQQIDERINTICEFLEEQQSPSQVKGIVLGGSYGRNTVLKGHSDGTIVIFFSEPFAEARMKQIFIRDFNLRRTMEKFEIVNEKLQLELRESELTITFDILPIFSTLVEPSGWQTSRDNKPSINTYQKWIHPGKSAFESPFCFTELQRRFFSNLPPKLKDLILLVKHWYQQCQKQLKQDSFPLQYALELLTVYAWEQGSGKDDFNIAEGILTVLELVTKYKELCIYWTVNYDFEDETIRNYLQSQLRKDRPIILDPADPTRNVGESDPNLWKQLAEEAKTWSTFSAFKKKNSSSWKPWDILPASLYVTRGHMLDKFIYDFLQPKQESLEQIKEAVNTIFKFLTEKCFKDSTMTVKKVVMAGSIAKGTALKSISDPEWNLYPRGSDADLVVFLNCFQNYNDQIASRATIIKEIQNQLEHCPLKDFEIEFEVTKWKNPRVLSFTLKSKLFNRCQEFDLLPAFDALGPQVSKSKPDPEIYISLIKSSKCNSGSEFSTCFTELQRNFIRPRTTKLKSLIRLMKHWYKQCHKKLKKKGSLPPKYAVELLTVYAWEQGSGMHDFNTAEGFLTVLKLIMQYKELCIYWTVNYDFQNEIIRNFLLSQLNNSRPVILDPADPTGDVGGGDRWCWHLLAHEAEIWSSSLCFKSGDFSPVMAWQVPTVQTPGSSGLRLFPTVKPIFSSTGRMFAY